MKRWALVVDIFGPAVFFLYVERWRRLHPLASREAEQPA
jgi:hypothetical protein